MNQRTKPKGTMKIANIHLINPQTPAAAGRYVGSIILPDDFSMPGEDELLQFEGCGLIVSVAEVEADAQSNAE